MSIFWQKQGSYHPHGPLRPDLMEMLALAVIVILAAMSSWK